ncbi:hypothetical protein [Trinickia mobilis]|uniref:hypothetical protein n=1 Tax=Trinickia mobilis TaxID=2816356 RepID=UPI001A8D8D21|nr:hypothetical protein [Trinickia mobilis]
MARPATAATNASRSSINIPNSHEDYEKYALAESEAITLLYAGAAELKAFVNFPTWFKSMPLDASNELNYPAEGYLDPDTTFAVKYRSAGSNPR